MTIEELAMLEYMYLFGASLVFIAMRAFQQLNVQHHRYMWVPPVTVMMALCEVLTITGIIKANSLWSVIPLAGGGILGCWFSMWFHQYMRNRGNTPVETVADSAVGSIAMFPEEVEGTCVGCVFEGHPASSCPRRAVDATSKELVCAAFTDGPAGIWREV